METTIRDTIRDKAFLYVDETSSAIDTLNVDSFPIDALIDEAGRLVMLSAPLRALGKGKTLPLTDFTANADGSGSVALPADFLRLATFKIKGWKRPATTIIYDTDITYAQQFNRVLRGSDSRPVVVLCKGNTVLEYYASSSGKNATIDFATYIGYSNLDNNYPSRLIEVTAWKLAELTFSIMSDNAGMVVCQNKINEIMQLL